MISDGNSGVRTHNQISRWNRRSIGRRRTREHGNRRRCADALGALAKVLESGSAEERSAVIPVIAGLGGAAGLAEAQKYSSEKTLKSEVAAACEKAGDADCAVRLYSECLSDGLAPRACSAGLARLNSAAVREAAPWRSR